MKRLFFYSVLISVALTSCAPTIHEIGSIGMLSDKKIDAGCKYQKLATNAGRTKKELRKTHAENIDAAINQVLAKVPGAEYLTNVTIYAVDGDYLAVSGDIWGKKSATPAVPNNFGKRTAVANNSKVVCKN